MNEKDKNIVNDNINTYGDEVINHSVTLDISKCKGCTNCIKRCPTEAIRVRDNHARIENARCIDCGECIRTCPYKAKKALYDKFEDFENYKYKIALPAPALYGQFEELTDMDYLLTALVECGFDEVFEVARAAEIASEYTRKFLEENGPESFPRPVISSACPVVVRLIGIRYPLLRDQVLPVLAPIEIAARIAKKEALEKHPELAPEDICVLFISPCPAKVSYVKSPLGTGKSAVDGALSISDFFFKLRSKISSIEEPYVDSKSGIIGISWASTGGEARSLFNDKYLAADGIENVIKVLDEIDNSNIRNVDFVELNACSGGCVGGVLNIENPYIAKARLQTLRRYLPVSMNRDSTSDITYKWDEGISYDGVAKLSDDRREAMRKMREIEEISSRLPQIDCGSCGAPTCRALAEDIVKGKAKVEDCVIVMRNKLVEFLHNHSEINPDELGLKDLLEHTSDKPDTSDKKE